MRDRMRVRPDARPSADDAPTGPIPRVAVPTQLPRSKGQTKAAGCRLAVIRHGFC